MWRSDGDARPALCCSLHLRCHSGSCSCTSPDSPCPTAPFLYKAHGHVSQPGNRKLQILDCPATTLRNSVSASFSDLEEHTSAVVMHWKSTSTSDTSSSKASSLFGLDEDDKSNILVYKFRSGQKALEISSQHDLCKVLDSGESFQPSAVETLGAISLTSWPQTQNCLSCASPRRRFREATAA